MTWLRNRKTMSKLMMAFGLLAVLIGFVGYQGMRGMEAIDAGVDVIYEKHAVGLDAVRGAQLRVLDISREVRNVILDLTHRNPAALDRRREYIQKATAEFDDRFKKYEQTIVLAATREKAAAVPKMFQALRAEQDQLMALAAEGKLGEAYAGLGVARKDADAIEAAMQELVTSKRTLMKEAAADASHAFERARAFIIGLIVIAVALAIGLGVFIARLISRPLVATVALLQDMAQGEGDLTKRLEVNSEDEVGELARWFNAFMDKLHDIIAQAKGVALHMAEASTQLSAATEQMASGAQEQASSLEETAASLEQITGTVKQNADNARQASELAAGSRGTAEKGGHVVAAAVAAMGEINQSSRKVADIITTIDEIAFQTNLLALNAAVEAARAGEQGRGFAVVAAEVRNLAQRSAGAAKEIKGLILDSVGKVEAGSALVNQSGQTLDEIVTSVKRVTDIIAEIAAASQEQSTGVEQVNRAVTQMDQVVQGNAAQTEELSSTAHALAGQAGDLQALVGRFKLAGDGRAALAAAPARPALPRSGASRPVRPGAARATPTRAAAKKITEPAGATASAKHDHGADDGFEEF